MRLGELIGGPNGLMPFVLVLGAVSVMLLLVRRYQARHARDDASASEQIQAARDGLRVRQSMDELLVQLEECARRVNAQLDTKFARLEAVVRDADDRIARLAWLLEQVEQVRGRLAARSARPGAGADSAPRVAPGQREDTASRAGAAPASRPPLSDETRERVYALSDAGRPAIVVAEALGLTLGEVELLLALRGAR